MADQNTGPDAAQVFLTGAGSDGGIQTDPAASLGNYRSSKRLGGMGVTRTSNISNVTIMFAGALNGEGAGQLKAVTSNSLSWAANGGSEGPAVSIANGETKQLQDGTDPNKFILARRDTASNMSGTDTVTLAYPANELFPSVSSAEASAGGSHYVSLMVRNTASAQIVNMKAYLATLGAQQTSDTAQLGASGSGTVGTSGSFETWPATGFCRRSNSGGVQQEIFYYSSRTNSDLTVPAAGRGLGGTTASAGASTDKLDAIPGMRVAVQAPTSNALPVLANNTTSPTGVSWTTGITAAGGASIGTLSTGTNYGLHLHQFWPAGTIATPYNLDAIIIDFDSN